jgi:hypothetical protein
LVGLITILRLISFVCTKDTCPTLIGEGIVSTIITLLNKTNSILFQLGATNLSLKERQILDLKCEREHLELISTCITLLYSVLRILAQSEPEFKHNTLIQTLLSVRTKKKNKQQTIKEFI